MKYFRAFLLALLLVVGAGYYQAVKAQGAIIDVLGSGLNDADKLMNAYLQPFGESFAIGLGQNWNNTANTLKLLRFNVQAGFSVVLMPDEKRTFDPQALGMENLRPLSNTAPTVLSPFNRGPGYELSVANPENPSERIVIDTLDGLTRGLGVSFNAVPFLQLNIGLVKGTELSVRFVPTIDLSSFSKGSGSIGMWGVGLKHEIKQWIPGVKKLPFSLSGYFNYSRLTFDLGVNLKSPESKQYKPFDSQSTQPQVVGFDYTNQGPFNFANQSILMDASSMGFGIIASKKVLAVTPFISFGIQKASFSLRTAGQYAVLTGLRINGSSDPLPGAAREQYRVFTDPINIEPAAISDFRYSVGCRLKVLIFGIHAEYFGIGAYTGGNVGVSLGF
jgi:hypothetical protein